MNAVLDKPRAKATPKATKSVLQTRLDSIFANLKLGQEKLQLAHQSVELTDPGDAADVLLRAVIEEMLPPAIAPMYRQPLTRSDADAAYTGMFTSLAAIEGVIALSRGQVIEPMLREAWMLLDEANSQMDFTDMKGLPEAKEDAAETTSAQDAEHLDEQHDPYCVILQARDVAQAAADIAATDMHWGIHSLIEKVVEKVERAHTAHAEGAHSKDLHDSASNELAGLLGIIRVVNSDSVDDGLLYAAETLVTVAKAQIDADNERAAQARKVAA